ncbi:hypothetical protein SAMN05216184_10884 [Georgenia satyanarayanai]|uniref:Uncharacterized protein n=1 Tax=Georgenia satyanarayanai TaxID=860221 RepID=A0A2Y9AG81_9MICO|nr:hypothetical protein [Georgenia satyanarayanai]PYF99202.1 hypothetical protein A8987_10884 [Georgenia satyanarayanai]SSA43320.1 hypothetical protein SAMN05216184_10884 [Georgenia satyanarayanai]
MESTTNEVWHRPFVKEHQQWCDDFVVELRLLDVPGPVIGDRLAEVEAHCTDTGESPAQAFGDPVGYARSLDVDRSPAQAAGVRRVAVVSGVQVLALLVGTSAAFAWARGEDLSYNIVQVGATVLFIGVLLAIPALLRHIITHPWAVGMPLIAVEMLLGGGAALAGRLDLPALLALPPAAPAVGLFVVVVALAVVEYRELTKDGDEDLVTSPLSPAPEAPAPRRRSLVTLMPAVMVPASYVVLSVLPWVVS